MQAMVSESPEILKKSIGKFGFRLHMEKWASLVSEMSLYIDKISVGRMKIFPWKHYSPATETKTSLLLMSFLFRKWAQFSLWHVGPVANFWLGK